MTGPATPAANDAAAAYQRLRSHLAYLKLPAAAEALPGILDAARDQHLTVLDALERLLGTEAAAAEARKLASRLRLAALPAPWSLDDYDFSAQPGADEKLIGELASCGSSARPPTFSSSARRGSARPCCRSPWPAPPRSPGTRCTSPPART
jgi:hypothetical protein